MSTSHLGTLAADVKRRAKARGLGGRERVVAGLDVHFQGGGVLRVDGPDRLVAGSRQIHRQLAGLFLDLRLDVRVRVPGLLQGAQGAAVRRRHPAAAPTSSGPRSAAVSFTAPMTVLTSPSESDGCTGMLTTCSVSRSVTGKD